MLKYKRKTWGKEGSFRRKMRKLRHQDRMEALPPEKFYRIVDNRRRERLFNTPEMLERKEEAQERTQAALNWVPSKQELVQSICKDSFYDFVREFWSELIAEEPVWNWHIEFFCNELQEMAERVFKGERKLYDLVVNVPPGTTKSTVFSILFPAWVWTRMPSARFICGSHALNLAMDLARKSRLVIKSEKYQKLFPYVVISDEQDTKSYFVNTKGGQRFSIGSTGNVIGMHAHFIIIDDPIDPKGAISEAVLKDTNLWIDETLSRRKVSQGISPTILVMQRLHEDDPSGHKLRRKGKVKHICLPATKSDMVCPAHLARMYVNNLLDPVRLDEDVLEDAKSELGPYGYAGQYDQSPTPRGGGMFQVDRIIKAIPPFKFKSLVRYWDKAATEGGGAFTVGALMGFDGRFYWILDVIRGQWDSGRREVIIRQTAEKDGTHVVVGLEQEPGSGGKESTQSTIRNLAGYRVRVNKPQGDKIIRADAFSSQVNNGLVRMKPGGWNQTFMDEARFFPFSRYKDQIDAATGGFSLLSKPRIIAGAIR